MKQTRITNTIELMKTENIDGLIYGPSANFQYLLEANDFYWQRSCDHNIMGSSTGYLLPQVLLLLNSDGSYYVFTNRNNRQYFETNYPGHVIVSYMDQFEDALAPYITGKKYGVGLSAQKYITDTLLAINKNLEIINAEDLLKDIRAIKDADEIEAIRKICRFTDEAVMYVVNNFKEGMSAREAENLLIEYGLMNNIDDLSFPPTVGIKTQNTITTQILSLFDRDWKLQPQSGIAFDVGYMNNGYCSDWGRTLYYGKAPEICKKGYEALNAAILSMVDQIVPYKTNNNELYAMVAKKVDEMGMLKYLRYQDVQMLGHQIGIDCHEFPLVNKDYDFVLKPGMTFAVEPKMWFENEMFMRVEDIILITETGAEILTNFPRDLFEIDVKK